MSCCKKCGLDTTDYMQGSHECANCWEVEGRLDAYLRSEHGKKFVQDALVMAETDGRPEYRSDASYGPGWYFFGDIDGISNGPFGSEYEAVLIQELYNKSPANEVVYYVGKWSRDAKLSGWTKPGWYFRDETSAHFHGPYGSQWHAQQAAEEHKGARP